jgi:hypothetical protein
MGKYFTEEQIDEFISTWIEKYPDALERSYEVIRRPRRETKDLMNRNIKEKREVADSLAFFVEHKKNHSAAYYELEFDVMDRC